MNKQGKNGIEWTDYTWNPVGGCKHACRWEMPDGTTAICYAEAVANGVARHAYEHGFEHHYWHRNRLDAPSKVKKPSKIFLDSMSDLMGHWVLSDQIDQVLDVVRNNPQHQFQLLTKNAPRLVEYRGQIPDNLWVGVSAPPSYMFGKRLTHEQQTRMVKRQIDVLADVSAGIQWMSIEPLSFDIAPLLKEAVRYEWIDWVVIGAATNGRKSYQPDPTWVQNVLDLMDSKNIPVFFKGNLHWSPWREDFPQTNGITNIL